jgi:steroid delta-isomerase-like uncharacterized protein
MATEHVKEIARRIVEDVWNARDAGAVDQLYAPDFHNRDARPGMSSDRDGIKQTVSATAAAFPDFRLALEDAIADGDVVVTRWTFTGTHTGSFWGIPPTGREVRFTGVTINRLRDGRCVEEWTNSDSLGMLQQLGVIPSPSAG